MHWSPIALIIPLLLLGCEAAAVVPADEWACTLAPASDPDYAHVLGCQADYDQLAAQPADASIPGATSIKTIVDRLDDDQLWFQNSKRYCIHWEFAVEHLSGDGLPIVPEMGSFNETEYYSPDRRFLLGAISHYDGPDRWVYEISPYDTADADMVTTAFREIRDNLFIGEELAFHPTSQAVEAVAADLPDDIPVVSSELLYEGVDYQPLNLGTSMGQLRLHAAADVEANYINYREIVVLDAVPNDISIVAGIITAQFQTPLSHINVLSVSRGTPNMALTSEAGLAELAALDGKWVELTVGAFDWQVREVTTEVAEAWWQEHKPEPLTVSPMNLAVTELTASLDMLDLDVDALGDAISAAIPIYGAKATNYGALAEANLQGQPIPIQTAFAIPMYYYNQFMDDNGLWDRMAELMASPDWTDPTLRGAALLTFQEEMRAKPVRTEVVEAVVARAAALFPGEAIRFRSSTNAEDLGTFTGAGLYDSETGDPSVAADGKDSVEWAMKKVWSQVWNPRAYEEREYYSMRQTDVGMALLTHANFPEEEANGVAITNNPFDPTGLEPALYVNAQEGVVDVVAPEPGVLPDAYIHYYYSPGQPIVFVQHSTLVPAGETVLTNAEAYELGTALDAISTFFRPAYGTTNDWYAMDVEWKFDDKYTPGDAALFVKQARPFAGWSNDATGACATE